MDRSAPARVSIEGADRRFAGEYVVTKATHTFDRESSHAWTTWLQVVRADRASYSLPEAGDEVLIAFGSGDLRNPFVVGSLWDGDSNSPAEASACGRARADVDRSSANAVFVVEPRAILRNWAIFVANGAKYRVLGN